MKSKTIPTEKEIDEIIESQVDDDSEWEEPVPVSKAKQSSVNIPSELAKRAEFFARLHRESSAEEWLKRIIQERLDTEEAIFAELKRELTSICLFSVFVLCFL